MMIYETLDGKGGWTAYYKMEPLHNRMALPGQCRWIRMKRKWGIFWVRDERYMALWDWPELFRPLILSKEEQGRASNIRIVIVGLGIGLGCALAEIVIAVLR